ncbi:putative porin [Pedobacter caeni]|uniref:Putative porin n=1 Tax=Pedobacter caeni TaxID=288992 RepID=A0A1M5E772_9SPHI|nr:putative porin [Pedobacter caeni]SHF75015.1 Putative porin [Pedobacter caeni]
MYKNIALFLFCFLLLSTGALFAQDLKTKVNDNKLLDSLRKKEESGLDSVIFTSRFIRYTTLKLTKDSIQTLALDTSLNGFQNFSVIAQPRRPTVGIGNLGLAAMPMLFEPLKTIGFEAGFHSLDFYAIGHDDIKYYKARTPYTNLYFASAGETEAVFKVTHSQNIKPNWNIGANFNRIGANGYYIRQRGDHLNADLFNWYESPNKRYNLFVNAIFNTLKARENGAVVNYNIYNSNSKTLGLDHMSESVRLGDAGHIYRANTFMIKQTYFVGRIDTLAQEISDKILPTNKIAYTFKYNQNSYTFHKASADDGTAIPRGEADVAFTYDSTRYSNVQNEFMYSFFLRAKGNSIIKNELKLDAGIRHDFYKYSQGVYYSDKKNTYYDYKSTFQNLTLLGSAGYRFSSRIDLNVDVQQIFQGRNAGDFLYEAKSNVLLSKSIGRVILGGYFQNKSPEEVYNRYFGNHYNWNQSFNRTKTINLSFKYYHDRLKFEAAAEYYLINDYLYFRAASGSLTVPDSLGNATNANNIVPAQLGSINLLKITLGKKLNFGKFNLDSYLVYQKTDNPGVLRTPEVYAFASLYLDHTFFKSLKTNIGFDIRYNTPYKNYSYSAPAGQFYVGEGRTFDSYPILDVWVKASLRKANLFVKTDYANQGLLSKGYYSVNRYPMMDRVLFKFGVSWSFYD